MDYGLKSYDSDIKVELILFFLIEKLMKSMIESDIKMNLISCVSE